MQSSIMIGKGFDVWSPERALVTLGLFDGGNVEFVAVENVNYQIFSRVRDNSAYDAFVSSRCYCLIFIRSVDGYENFPRFHTSYGAVL